MGYNGKEIFCITATQLSIENIPLFISANSCEHDEQDVLIVNGKRTLDQIPLLWEHDAEFTVECYPGFTAIPLETGTMSCINGFWDNKPKCESK